LVPEILKRGAKTKKLTKNIEKGRHESKDFLDNKSKPWFPGPSPDLPH